MAKQKAATGLSEKANNARGKSSAPLPSSYVALLADLKCRVRAAQLRAAVSVNRELIVLYWDIGKVIVEAQQTKGYGRQVVQRLARDLQNEFPGMAGFSPQNVWHMRSFYLAWTEGVQKLQQPVGESTSPILQQPVGELGRPKLPPPLAEIPWGHNLILLGKLKTPPVRLWYARKAMQNGWSRAMLAHHIETQLHLREGKAANNFQRTLTPPQSDLADQMLKDPYNFDFLTLRSDAQERDLEQGLARTYPEISPRTRRRLCVRQPAVSHGNQRP